MSAVPEPAIAEASISKATTSEVATTATVRRPFQFSLQMLLAQITLAGIVFGVWSSYGGWAVLWVFVGVLVCAAVEDALVRPRRYLFALLLLEITLVSAVAASITPIRFHTPSKRSVIRTHLQVISQSLRQYEHQHGHWPPQTTQAITGVVHSWRASLLEMLSPVEMAQNYDWTSSWKSRNNRLIGAQAEPCFSVYGSAGETSFVALDVPGGYPDGKFLVMFVTHSGIETLEPRDVTVADLTSGKVHGAFGLGSPVVLLWPDGEIENVSMQELEEKVEAYLTWKRKEATQPNGGPAIGN